MSHYTKRIIDTLLTAVEDHKTNTDFTTYNDFTIVQRPRITIDIDTLSSDGTVLLLALKTSYHRVLRSHAVNCEIRVQVGTHFRVTDVEDLDEENDQINLMVEFVEELVDICNNTNNSKQGGTGVFSFTHATYADYDEDLTYNYDALRHYNIFQSIFTATWNATFPSKDLTYIP